MSPQLCVQRRGCLRTDPWVGDRRRGESPFAKGGPDPQQAVFSVSEAALHSLPGIPGGSLGWEREFGGLSCNHTGAAEGFPQDQWARAVAPMHPGPGLPPQRRAAAQPRKPPPALPASWLQLLPDSSPVLLPRIRPHRASAALSTRKCLLPAALTQHPAALRQVLV